MIRKFKSKEDAIRRLKVRNWEKVDVIPFHNKKTKRDEIVKIIFDSGTGYYYTFHGLKLIGKKTNMFSASSLGGAYVRKLEKG